MGRRLGQHFLTRKSILDRIADAACKNPTPLVIEIGPGKGTLTESLLERAEKVVAIEVDPVLVHYLRQKFQEPLENGRLELIEGDILKVNLSAWGPCAIAGNLPYYITSPIIERVVALGARGVFLVQAEVAARLAAAPGTRDFGYLSVHTQLYSKVEILFPVSRTAFRPIPKVDSAVTLLEPRELEVPDTEAFLRFASASFRHKRKTLRNNLNPIYGKERVDALIRTNQRAEQLSVAELVALWRKLQLAASPSGDEFAPRKVIASP